MTLDEIDALYSVILCDIWGCVHDGVRVLPGVAERLDQWRSEGRAVILITNAPRTAKAVEQHLLRLGLEPGWWGGIATAGDAGIAALKKIGVPVGFIGTAADRATVESQGVEIVERGFDQLACAGLDFGRKVADYDAELRDLAGRGVVMHCLNPDRVVMIGGRAAPCAGALADRYIELGGEVAWYGKPFEAIYRHAMALAGDPPPGDVLAIGDGLETDILGAARMGYPAVFVRGGINRGAPFPDDFASRHDLGDWRPAAIVDSLL
jgi:HAD superfamily hydrolase (TIGR01459 family)